MKKIVRILVIAVCFIASMNVYAGNGNFGIGVVFGEPTGISIKSWTSRNAALCFAAGWSLTGNEYIHVQGDVLIHKFNIIPVENASFPVYFGIGGRVIIAEVDDDIIGARVPIGLDYIFREVPIDIFLEIAPVMNIIPETDFDVAGGLGIRYFF